MDKAVSFDALSTEVEFLRDEVQKLEYQLHHQGKEKVDLQGDYERYKALHDNHSAELEALQSQLTSLHKDHHQLQQELNAVETDRKHLETALEQRQSSQDSHYTTELQRSLDLQKQQLTQQLTQQLQQQVTQQVEQELQEEYSRVVYKQVDCVVKMIHAQMNGGRHAEKEVQGKTTTAATFDLLSLYC